MYFYTLPLVAVEDQRQSIANCKSQLVPKKLNEAGALEFYFSFPCSLKFKPSRALFRAQQTNFFLFFVAIIYYI